MHSVLQLVALDQYSRVLFLFLTLEKLVKKIQGVEGVLNEARLDGPLGSEMDESEEEEEKDQRHLVAD